MMIPSVGPRSHTYASREGVLYQALATLPDDFYVVHSMGILLTDATVEEAEADFVVFNKELGILCIEAKSGGVKFEDGIWKYGSGVIMDHGGPYSQASRAKHMLIKYFDEHGMKEAKQHCKFHHAVWFLSLPMGEIARRISTPEANMAITLSKDDLADPEPRIREILSLELYDKETSLSDKEADDIVRRVLCPEFNIVPTSRVIYDAADMVFARLLDSQIRVLDFISDQRFAVINGAAGTGKTLIAMERARRAVAGGGRVLFLCFNAALKDDIAAKMADVPGVDVKTIAGYACSVCKTSEVNYEDLSFYLIQSAEEGSFPYSHVIVDEAQDFAIRALEEAQVLEYLRDAVSKKPHGSFYLFYDRRQLVQGSNLPTLISDADCKLTLYVNCRNTRKIAECSLKGLKTPEDCEVLGARTGGTPVLFASKIRAEQERYVDERIAELRESGLRDVVVLSLKTAERSAFSQVRGVREGYWKSKKVRFSTCRKFKGLEADAIILVDVDHEAWQETVNGREKEPGLLFYTGASRAKHRLFIVCDMGPDDCAEVLGMMGAPAKGKPIGALARKLGAINDS